MFPISDPENIKLYNQKSIFDVFKNACREDLDKSIEHKRIILNNFFQSHEAIKIKKVLSRYALIEKKPLNLTKQNFCLLNDKIYPIIMISQRLKEHGVLSNKEALQSLFFNQQGIESNKNMILYCCHALQEMIITDSRYGTDFINNEWKILGKDSYRKCDLIYLAHELGHCVYNFHFGCNDFFQQVKSEVCAYLFEYIIAKNFLSQADFKIWLQHIQTVDSLNEYLFYLEYSLIEEYQYLSSNIESSFFDSNSLSLIESFWTSHGYQLVYHLAAKIRNAILIKYHYH